MKCDKERKPSNWSQNAPDPSLIELDGMCLKNYAPMSAVGMRGLTFFSTMFGCVL